MFIIAARNQLVLPMNCMDLNSELLGGMYNQNKIKDNKINLYIKSILKYIIYFLPIPYGVLLGGVREKWEKYIYVITIVKLKRLKCSINNQLKNDFLKDVEMYFDKDGFNQFRSTLSDKFFLNSIKTIGLPSSFYGSPDNLFKEEFCKLLFVDQKLKIIGIQHGGATLEYAINRFNEYDKSISDKMLYWGLGHDNIKQNRFKVNGNSFGSIKKSYLVEAIKPNVIIKEFFGGSDVIYKEAEEKRNTILSFNSIGIVKHPRSMKKNYSAYSSAVLMSDLTAQDRKKSLFIMDKPCHTFIYKSIYENLPFLILINRNWHQWCTVEYSLFLKFLNKQKTLFYWDQEEEFNLYMKQIMKTGKMLINTNIHISKYLESNKKPAIS